MRFSRAGAALLDLPALLPWRDEMQFMRRTRNNEAWKMFSESRGKALKNQKLISRRKSQGKISSATSANAAP
jgi:hypothetical protein